MVSAMEMEICENGHSWMEKWEMGYTPKNGLCGWNRFCVDLKRLLFARERWSQHNIIERGEVYLSNLLRDFSTIEKSINSGFKW